jgi:putative ABC transport system permease protein
VIAQIAWKNLSRERMRLAVSVGGVAFAVLLILLLRGLYRGITDQATEYIRSVGAEVWVAQAGTPGDLFHSGSLLPRSLEAELESVDGVDQATPFVMRSVVFRHRGKDRDFRLVGVDPRRPSMGPPGIVSGRNATAPGEIVVDRVFARNAGVDVGETLSIRQRDFKVVGLARGGNTIVTQYAWAPLADAARVLELEGIANYFLIDVAPGRDSSQVAAAIRQDVPAAKPMLEEEFLDKNTADLREGFLPIVLVLVLVGFVIGTVVIGLTIYTATIEKRREYGVLKAIGFSNRRLYAIVYGQALVAAAIGFVVGLGLTFAVAAGVEKLVPSFATTLTGVDFGVVAAAALLMSGLASFIPVRPIARLQPAEVFRV